MKNPFDFIVKGAEDVAQKIKDSALSYFAGVPVSTKNSNDTLRVHMTDEQIKKATPTAPPRNAPSNPFNFLTSLPKTIVQGATRSALGYGTSLLGQSEAVQPGAIPNSKISPVAQIATYGKEPVTPFASSKTITGAKQGDPRSLLSIGGAGLGLGLNVVIDPASGAGKDLVRQLAKETTEEKIIPLLIKAGIPEDVARTVVPQIAKETSEAGVKDILGTAAKGARAEAEAANAAREAKAVVPDTPPLLPESTTLSNEARATAETAQNKPRQIAPPSPTEESQAKEAFAQSLPSAGLDVKSKVNIFDYLKTPETVLQKIGLRNQAEKLRTSFDSYKTELGQQITYLRGLAEQVPGQESSKRIFQYLDGQAVSLQGKELEVATTVKDYLSKWADRLKLPEDGRISSYITHIFEQGFITKEFDPEVAKIIADKVPGSVYDPFVEKRLGKLGYVEDVWRALDAYVKRGVRKVNMDPALLSLQTAADELDLESYKYVKRYVDNINMRPTELDSLLDNAIKSSPIGYKLGQRPTLAITQKWRNLIYRGALGFNLGSALRNLTQGVNTFAKLGARDTVAGYFNLLRNGTKELYENGVLENDLIQDKHFGVLKSAAQKIDNSLFAAFEAAEAVNRGAAYYGAKAKGLRAGMPLEKAITYAKRLVRETQFSFGAIDTPVALQSDIAKTLAQFQTFNVKQGEFLLNMAKNKEFGGLIRWIGGSLAMVYSIGRVLGMKPTDLIPSVKLGGSPLGTLITGAEESFSSNPQTKAAGHSKLKGLPAMLIPGGVQTKKTYMGLTTVSQGKSTTAAGKTRYRVKKTPANYIRAALFGPNSLPETQKYYANQGKPKTSNTNSTNPFSF